MEIVPKAKRNALIRDGSAGTFENSTALRTRMPTDRPTKRTSVDIVAFTYRRAFQRDPVCIVN